MLIIIGAGRSGTNALRDALTSTSGFGSWPCDEINYIWRSGNRSHPTDELGSEHVGHENREFIQSQFEKQQAKIGDRILVEKTCANSLRPEYVRAIFPSAHVVHIIRDGRDVASSAMSRWTAELDLRYVLRKARFVPPKDLPYYATKYLTSRVKRFRDDEKQLSTWGPRFEGIDEVVRSGTSLPEVCAHQWVACTKASVEGLGLANSGSTLNVRYEEFTAEPMTVLSNIAKFAGAQVSESELLGAAGTIRAGSVGAWRDRLSTEEAESVENIVGPLLGELGYE